ncbi:ribonuclease P protein component [Celeribacter indicus]|uniref:Ribonuclease P protein component n=1 Tax=Celeribacter indicus TaxID=1208324 RepID=A0A0B5DYV5_9RHOB|nr:ribonuclease P protein component [Celeribacter indicus]AJE45412.1 ribonuclease P protein component [Celeribacter indicus]SDX01304.1 ribonuclease P protein component [Celeribacter indicus]
MTPPDAPEEKAHADARGSQSAVLSCPDAARKRSLETLRKRADFLRAARARRQGTAGFLLQGRKRGPEEPAQGIRVGYTCSKKVGNAVRRNHAKRRLREAARLVLPGLGRDGWDYVLIGKKHDTAARPFTLLLEDLRYALRKVHGETR